MNLHDPNASGEGDQPASEEVRDIDGVLYYRDPPRDQILKIVSNTACKSLRGLIINSSVYWWDAFRIGHEGAAKKLGAYFDKNDRLMLDDKEGHPEITVFSQSARGHSKVTALGIPVEYEND